MTLTSTLRLWDFVRRQDDVNSDGIIELSMKRPFRGKIALRNKGSDLATFHEIVVDEIYNQVVRTAGTFETIIDLGANIGLASLYLAQHSPSCKIFSVEPNPDSYKILVRNMRNLGSRCRTLRAAAWGSYERLSPDPEVPKDRFSTTRMRECGLHGQGAWSVEGFTLPQIFEYSGFNEIDLLKMDVEGAEAEIFSGKDLHWLSRVGAIAVEFHKDSRKECRFDEIMNRYGFEISDEEQHTVLAIQPKWSSRCPIKPV